MTAIQRYSLHDGPGIRTLVFFKGCRLACEWCENPETLRPKPQLLFIESLCIACGLCPEACPEQLISLRDKGIALDRDRCTECGACAEVCYPGALAMAGRYLSVEDIMADVRKDEPFYASSGGGLTLSGGEVLVYAAFATRLLSAAQEKGIHTAIETSGFGRWSELESIVPHTDLFLFDIKHVDPAIHRARTSRGNAVILGNLARLRQADARVIIRIPVIPGFSDDVQTVAAIGQLAVAHGIGEVHLLPFHQFGQPKWDMIGRPYAFGSAGSVPEGTLAVLRESLESLGLDVSLGGN